MKKPLSYIDAIAILNELNQTMFDNNTIPKEDYFKNCDFLQKLIFRSVVFGEKRPGLIESVESLNPNSTVNENYFQNSFMTLQAS